MKDVAAADTLLPDVSVDTLAEAPSEPPPEASGDQDQEDRENLRVLVAERESAIGIKVADKNKLKRLTFGGVSPPIGDLGLERLSAWYDALDQWDAERTAAAAEQKQGEPAGT